MYKEYTITDNTFMVWDWRTTLNTHSAKHNSAKAVFKTIKDSGKLWWYRNKSVSINI